jgi:hypothetical protein
MDRNETNTLPDKKYLRHNFTSHNNFTGGGLLLYIAIFMGFQVLAEVIYAVVLLIRDPDLANFDRFSEYYNELIDLSMNGWIYIASLVLGIGALFLFFRKRLAVRDIFASPKKMTGRAFITIFFIFFAGQFIGQIINIVLELILNLFGLSNEAIAELMADIFNHPSMIVYAAIFGPIAEELVFRGFLLRRFQAWGKIFAIVASSVLFGLFHMNFVQIPYAIIVGLVLAYTAMEYGIKWSMIFHIINNGILSCGFAMLGRVESIGDTKATVMELGFLAISFIVGAILFVNNFAYIKEYVRRNRTEGVKYLWFFLLTVTIVIFVLLAIGMAVFTLLSSVLLPMAE